MRQERAVVLLSGGLDSCTAAAEAKAAGFALYTLSFQYGQRHARELACAEAVAKSLDAVEHRTLTVPVGELGGSALTDNAIDVPDAPDGASIGDKIPDTYVPARNTVFLSLALAYAEVVGAEAIYIGANALDYSGYPDCRPEYLQAFAQVARLGTKRGVEGDPVRIEAPLVEWTKQQIIERATELDAPLELTWSCYQGGDRPCGTCESCVLRRRGFAAAGVKDPALRGQYA